MVPAMVETIMTGNYVDDHLSIDRTSQTASVDRRRMILTRKEFELLAMLTDQAGSIVRRQDLLLEIWGYSTEIRTRTLDVHIRRLRAKIESDPAHPAVIQTVRGLGYKAVAEL